MDMEGRPIDWSRADNEGNFSLALPRPGRYLVVTSADGWSPRSQVISFDSAQSTHTVELGDRLTISGKVGVGGRTTSGTVVTLTKPTGEFVASTVTDGTGHYGIALPTSGRYILTALTESGHGTLARQIAVIAHVHRRRFRRTRRCRAVDDSMNASKSNRTHGDRVSRRRRAT